MAIVDALMPEFDHEMSVTRKLLERYRRSDSAGSRTRSRTRSVSSHSTWQRSRCGDRSRSISRSSIWVAANSCPRSPTARGLLALFDGHVAGTRAALTGKSDAELMAPWTLKNSGKTLFSMPKAAVWRSFVMSHLIHHRGQLSVYLRIQNVALPSMYGPSADENPFV